MAEIRVLGPIGFDGANGEASHPGPRMRRLLAALVMAKGDPVPVERLVDAVWYGERPPEGATTLPATVTRLRRLLDGAATIERRAGGYALRIDDGAVDAHRFERDVTADGSAGSGHNGGGPVSVERMERLQRALSDWRGRAYEEFAGEPWIHAEAERLEELRATAAEELLQGWLHLGQHDRVLAEVGMWIPRHPLRWRFRAVRMVALYRSGRQAEALRTYQDFRSLLADETGLDPNRTLVDLERRIAAGDESLRQPSGDPGRPLRGYRLLDQLGEGAFSIVWRATQPSVGRAVAIKQIRAELANRPEFIRRFEAEAHLVAQLEHPHIVPLYDYWREPDSAYLVMRLLSGGTLDRRLVDRPLALAEVATMVEEVGSALAAAHRTGVVHRDVKPANVFLDADGHFYLGDFGIAIESDEADDPTAALSLGSPAYASPEQLRRQPVSPTADVHGLGITVYEALTGRLPFPDATSRADLLERQLTQTIPSVREVRTDVPPAVDDVLRAATAKDPAARQPDAAVFVEEFEAALGSGVGSLPTRSLATSTAVSVRGDENPYKGLRAFGENDAGDFFGRDRLVDRLVDALGRPDTGGRLVAVVGPSGSGKSSVLRAGLLPRLRAGAVDGSDRWFITTMTPGAHPFEELEGALSRVAVQPVSSGDVDWLGDGRAVARAVKSALPDAEGDLVLIVDQFEEVFTLCADEQERAAFLDGLHAAVTDPRSRQRVVLTLRADFWDRPLRYPDFGRLVDSGAVTVTALAADELEQAIVEPARRCGAEFEPGLVSRIVAGVTDQPGALPLLQYALTELYEQRLSGLMQMEAYEALGGVSGAIARQADELYLAADDAGHSAIHRVFGRLVSLGEGTADTRRRVRRSELGADAATDEVLRRYGDARLLTFDRDPADREPTVEVAHEALIREWPRLRSWLDEGRDELRALRHLTESAVAWDERGRRPTDLYRGDRLTTAVDLLQTDPDAIRTVEAEFIAAGTAETAAEEARERRHVRRLRRALVGVGIVAVVALLAGAIAVAQRRRADERTEAARQAAYDTETSRVGAQAVSLMETNPRVGLLLAAEAYRRDPSIESLGALKDTLTRTDNFLGYFATDRSYFWVGSSEAANRVYAATDTTIDVFDADTFEQVDEWPLPGPLPDRIMPTAANEGRNLQPAPDRDAVAFLDGAGDLWLVDDGGATVIASPGKGGSVTWSAEGDQIGVGLLSGQVVLVDSITGATLLDLDAHPERTFAEVGIIDAGPWEQFEDVIFGFGARVRIASDGTLWTTAGPAVRSWSPNGELLDDRRMLAAPTWPITGEFLGDVDTLQILSNPTWTWSLDGGEESVVQALTGRGPDGSIGQVKGIALDDRTVVALNTDGRIATYDRVTGEALADFIEVGLEEPTWLSLAPDGDRILASSAEGIGVWSYRADGLISRTLPRDGQNEVAVSEDGGMVAIGGAGGAAARLWSLEGSEPVEVPISFEPAPLMVDFPPGLPLVSAWSRSDDFYDVSDRYYDRQTLERRFVIPDTAAGWAAQPEEQWIAAGRNMSNPEFESFFVVTVFDATTGEQVSPDLHALEELWPGLIQAPTGGTIGSLTFSPDGSRLWGVAGGAIAVWDTGTWEAVRTEQNTGIHSAIFAPISGDLVTLDLDGRVSVRDRETLEVRRTIIGGEGIVELFGDGVWISPDEEWMVTTYDRVPRMFHYPTGQQVGGGWPRDPGVSTHISGDENGAWLAVGLPGEDRVAVWDLDTEGWFDSACRAVGRNLTQEEWDQYGPRDAPPGATCPQYPTAA